MKDPVRRNLRWNFTVNVLDIGLFFFGLGFAGPHTTVLVCQERLNERWSHTLLRPNSPQCTDDLRTLIGVLSIPQHLHQSRDSHLWPEPP